MLADAQSEAHTVFVLGSAFLHLAEVNEELVYVLWFDAAAEVLDAEVKLDVENLSVVFRLVKFMLNCFNRLFHSEADDDFSVDWRKL